MGCYAENGEDLPTLNGYHTWSQEQINHRVNRVNAPGAEPVGCSNMALDVVGNSTSGFPDVLYTTSRKPQNASLAVCNMRLFAK